MRKSRLFILSFSSVRPKRICFARKGILKDGKSAIFYLKQPGFSKWRLSQDGKTKREMPCVL